MTETLQAAGSGRKGIGKGELIALMACLMSVNSLAIDIMLPGLQEIGASLGVESENHRQYIISAYLIGFGIAQLAYGPISDRFGRRGPLLAGISLYVIGAIACALAPSFAILLIFRFIGGMGAAATRVISVSIVRDCYGGRQMAEVMSLIMMVFMIAPIIAPALGQVIMLFGEWHLIFVFLTVVGIAINSWIYLRLPETLQPQDVRPFTLASVYKSFKIVLTNRMALCYTLSITFIFGALFGFINSAQQIYVGIYGLGVYFPLAFAFVAAFMSLSSFVNSRIVGRIGMRRLSHGSLLGFLTTTGIWLLMQWSFAGPMPFPLFLGMFALTMFQFGWIAANFNSLAMEPLGHVAGTASSVLGFTSTVGGAVIGAAIGQAFDGTSMPLVAGFFTVSLIGLVFVLIAERGRLFVSHNPPTH